MTQRDPITGRFPKSIHGSAGKGSDIPAKGKGHGGPARGVIHPQGWGGPARGGPTRPPIKPGDPDGIQAMSTDPDVRERNKQRVEELKEHIYTLATTADRQETQLAASIAFIDREEGKPIQRQDVTSKGQQIGYVIAAPDEDESPEAWQARQASQTLQ